MPLLLVLNPYVPPLSSVPYRSHVYVHADIQHRTWCQIKASQQAHVVPRTHQLTTLDIQKNGHHPMRFTLVFIVITWRYISNNHNWLHWYDYENVTHSGTWQSNFDRLLWGKMESQVVSDPSRQVSSLDIRCCGLASLIRHASGHHNGVGPSWQPQ